MQRRHLNNALLASPLALGLTGLPALGLAQGKASGASSQTASALTPPSSWKPAKPVRILISVPPGGTMDVLTRAIANHLRDSFGVLLLDHKSGANGNIAMDLGRQAEPDGHTLVLGTASMYTINPHAYKEFKIDVFKDFEPIVLATRFETALCAHPSVPANNFAEFLSYCRANPAKASVASYGAGSLSHFVLELLTRATGVKIEHIPYRGATQALQDLLGGQIQFFINTVGQTVAPYAEKRMKVFATSGTKRSPFLPDVPTYTELGHKSVVGTGWFSYSAPKGTPKHITDAFNWHFNKALQSREVRAALLTNGMYPEGGTPQDLAKTIAEDYKHWGDLARAINLQRI